MEKNIEFYLKKIYVSNYRNLSECHIDFNNFAIIVGSNNSGKSNFIEIFEILNDIFYGGENGRKSAARKMLYCKKETIISFEYLVHWENDIIMANYEVVLLPREVKNEHYIDITSESLRYKSTAKTGKPRLLFKRNLNKYKLRNKNGTFTERSINGQTPVLEVMKSFYSDISTLPSDHVMLLGPLLVIISPSIFSAHKMTNYDADIENILEELYDRQERKDEKYVTFKKHFIEILGLKAVQFYKYQLPEGKSDNKFYSCSVIENETNDMQFIDFMSDGTKILFLLLYNIFIGQAVTNPQFVCIEEPEVGLHPRALYKLLEMFLNNTVQANAIITTHSPYLVKLVNPKNVFVSESNGDGTYSFKQVSTIKNLEKRLKSKYVDFGDLFVDNFNVDVDTKLD